MTKLHFFTRFFSIIRVLVGTVVPIYRSTSTGIRMEYNLYSKKHSVRIF
jgi:hypothetical protein